MRWTSLVKQWLSLPSSFGRQASMSWDISGAHMSMVYGTDRRMRWSCMASRMPNWAGSPTDRKSTLGGVFSIGSTTFSWYSRKQIYVELISVEAKYMATSQATCEAICMRKILVSLFGSHLHPTMIHCDNQSCIKLLINLVFMIGPSI